MNNTPLKTKKPTLKHCYRALGLKHGECRIDVIRSAATEHVRFDDQDSRSAPSNHNRLDQRRARVALATYRLLDPAIEPIYTKEFNCRVHLTKRKSSNPSPISNPR